MSTRDPTEALGAALRARGLSPTKIGRALLGPGRDRQVYYRTGARVLSGQDSHLSRLAELASALQLEIRLLPGGVVQVLDRV